MKSTRSKSAVLVALAIVLLGGAFGVYAPPATSQPTDCVPPGCQPEPPTFDACYRNDGERLVRIRLDGDDACMAHETGFQFGRGPQGPQGERGEPGPPGVGGGSVEVFETSAGIGPSMTPSAFVEMARLPLPPGNYVLQAQLLLERRGDVGGGSQWTVQCFLSPGREDRLRLRYHRPHAPFNTVMHLIATAGVGPGGSAVLRCSSDGSVTDTFAITLLATRRAAPS